MNHPAINTLNDKNFVSMEKFQDFDPNGEQNVEPPPKTKKCYCGLYDLLK